MTKSRLGGSLNSAFWLLASTLLAFFFGAPAEGFSQILFEPGVFQGVLQSDSNNDESFGFITIALTASGKFSMRFNLGVNRIGHHSYSKTGTFTNGVYHFEGPEVADTRYAVARFIDLQLEPGQSPMKINGTVTDSTHTSTVELERIAYFDALNPAPQMGRYTFLLLNPGDPGLPAGSGFGTMIIARSGRLSMSGRSADGRTFSRAAAVTVGERFPIFAKLGGSTKGILSGWLNFQETTESDFSGTLIWLGPEVPGPNNAFVPEFSGNVQAVGSRYFVPPGTQVIQTSSATNNIGLTLNSGGLETPIDQTLTLTSANRFIFSPVLPGAALSVRPLTGLFSGRFLHSDNHSTVFRGAILQKQNRGAGQFVDLEAETGNVDLQPVP
ncbi:MAG: hypothetical protein ABIR24_13935 [Verrucomicrobiota bacterium]